MNVVVKLALAIILSLISTQLKAQDTYTITVTVEDIGSNDGKIFLALYNSEKDFLENTYKGTKSEISNNTCTVKFENIPAGVYAVSIFHDENNNNKLDSNFIGIPKEDYGCSNNAKGFMGPPKWKDAQFNLEKDTSITITL
jgi:uncharacterized protein (DUF2141 family)